MDTKELQATADKLIRKYKKQITRDGDWWYGTADHDFNIHDAERTNGWYTINVYPYNPETGTDYSTWITLPFVRIKKA